jgi:hypothetical protein
MSLRNEQCDKVCRILGDVLANRPTERDALIEAVRTAFNESKNTRLSEWTPCSVRLPDEDHRIGGTGKQFSETVLVTVTNHFDEDAWVDITHTIDGKWMYELPRQCEVTAWAPLPEPYIERR